MEGQAHPLFASCRNRAHVLLPQQATAETNGLQGFRRIRPRGVSDSPSLQQPLCRMTVSVRPVLWGPANEDGRAVGQAPAATRTWNGTRVKLGILCSRQACPPSELRWTRRTECLGGGGCLGPDVVSYFLTPGGLSGGEYRRASKQEILAWCPADSVR